MNTARVVYNVVFSTYLGSNAAEKNEFNIVIAFLHISGLLVYLEIKIKKQFLKNYQKTYDSTLLFGYIFINHVQPFEAANISAAFF